MPVGTTFRPFALAFGFLVLSSLPAAAAVVINEIDYDQPGNDTSEFIELKNNGGTSVNLGTYTVELVNGLDGSVYQAIPLPAVLLPGGGYYVICFGTNVVNNCNLSVTPTVNGIQNGAPDAVGLRDNGFLVDAVSYEGNSPGYTEGTGIPLVNSDDNINLFVGISRFPDGVDTNNNAADWGLHCITPGQVNAPPTIPCNAIVPARRSAWGAIKSMYR
jgi:hypothetical protein